MKKQNYNYDDVILYRHPLGVTARPTRRGHRIVNFNDRSPEYRAMKAHLRASAYEPNARAENRVCVCAEGGSIGRDGVLSFLRLRRSYDEQARRNFVRDGVLLAVIVAMSAWALIHAVRAMTGS